MLREEMRREVFRVLVKMQEFEWKSSYDMLAALYKRLNETPADIEWDDCSIKMKRR